MIYPSSFPIHCHNRAEHKVFKALEELDPYDFDIFWNLTFAGKTPDEDKLYEIDFLIFDLRGERLNHIYVIEVKGGNLKFDASENTWYQSGRSMGIGPDLQAMNYASNIICRYQNQIEHKVPVTWLLWFPDGPASFENLPTQFDFWRILGQEDLDDPQKALDEVRESPNNRYYGFKGISLDEYEAYLKKDLLQDLGITQNLRTLLEDMNISMERAEANQKLFLTGFFEMPRLAVEGCAGSGKTILAKCGAELLNERGSKVLFLCFNKFLSHEVDAGLSEDIRTDTFHNFMRQFVDDREPNWFEQQQKNSHFFDKALPDKFRDLLRTKPPQGEEKVEVIIMDEAQDMEVGWLNLLLKFLVPNGKYFLFYDKRQNIFNKNFNLPLSEKWTKLPLAHNYRNTKKINHFINEQTGTNFMAGMVPEGEEVKLRTYTVEESGGALFRCLSEVHRMGKIALKDILIITDGSTKDWQLEELNDDNFCYELLEPETDKDPEKVYYTSINRFKGCEAEVVILLLNQTLQKTEDKNVLYTQMSRAKSLLYVLEPENSQNNK